MIDRGKRMVGWVAGLVELAAVGLPASARALVYWTSEGATRDWARQPRWAPKTRRGAFCCSRSGMESDAVRQPFSQKAVGGPL